MSESTHRGTIESLQVGRGFAAVAVLIAHSNTILAEPRFLGREAWSGFARFGAGVDFFFVLSGFIIAWAHWADLGRPDRIGRYAWRRFSRIYPPYWAILLPLSLLYAVFPRAGVPSQHDPLNFVFSLTLLPYPQPPILGVAWTLVYEMIFYALFGVLILAGTRALPALVAWGAAIVIANVAWPHPAFPFTILCDSLNLEFLAGIAAALVVRDGQVPAPGLAAATGLGGFVVWTLLGPAPADAPLLVRAVSATLVGIAILGLVELERGGRLAAPRPLVALGAASYALYLIHGVAISFGTQALLRVLGRGVPIVAAMASLAAIGIVAGLVFHRAVERPLSAWLRRRDPTQRPLPPNSSLP